MLYRAVFPVGRLLVQLVPLTTAAARLDFDADRGRVAVPTLPALASPTSSVLIVLTPLLPDVDMVNLKGCCAVAAVSGHETDGRTGPLW